MGTVYHVGYFWRPIGYLLRIVDRYPGSPTRAQAEWIDERDKELADVLARLKQDFDVKLAGFNAHLHSSNVPVVGVASSGETER